MELESIQSGYRNSDFPQNSKSEASDGDVKEAFLSVLEGLVGFLNPSAPIQSAIPEYKIAKIEAREFKKVEKEQPKFDKELDNSYKSKKEDTDATDATKVEVAKDPSVKEEVVEKAPEEAVKTDQCSEEQVDAQATVKEEVVNATEAVAKTTVVVETAENTTEKPVEEKVVAQSQTQVAETCEKAVDTKAVVKEASTEAVEEDVVVAAKKTVDENAELDTSPVVDSSASEEVVEVAPEAKSTVKVLNAKTLKPEGRSLEDEIEISYFEARDMMSKGPDILNTPVEKANFQQAPQQKELFGASALADLLRHAGMGGQNMFDMGANPLMAKNTNLKIDGSQASSQANKQVFEKSGSEKVTSNTFHARTAQAQVMIDKVKGVLEQAAINKTNDTITVKVEPANLGELTVKVSEKNGQIHAKITPESKEVEDILRSQSRELSMVIQALGYKEEDVQVSIGSASPDFYSSFSQSGGFSAEYGGLNKQAQKAGLASRNGGKESGINIDNNLTSEDLVGWIA